MKIFFILIIFIIFSILIIVRDSQIKKKKFKLNNLIAIVPTFFALFYKLQNILGVQV